LGADIEAAPLFLISRSFGCVHDAGAMDISSHPANSAVSILEAHLGAGLITPEQCALGLALVEEGQDHLFASWDVPGVAEEKKAQFWQALQSVEAGYPGGVVGYIRNARVLLREAAAGGNPFEGCTPEAPDMVDLSAFDARYEAAEELGWQALAETAVVLVAGGLGERLGYSGIKLDIPVEVTEGTSYLAHYAAVIRTASQRWQREIPLIIMTSQDTHERTVATLERENFFGLSRAQVTLLRQELVPALSDLEAHLALDDIYQLALKPHGHGDIHMLLHQSGTARRLAENGVRYLLFIQDTNGQVWNAACAALGVSEREGYDFNSIAVNRIPGEAVGGIARLARQGAPALTLNVEYNQLDPLLRATVSPAGDVPNEKGHSLFPGNINLLVIRLAPYLRVLEKSGGIIAEFINPKFADDTRTTFKKPARLETMMQDLPKLFVEGEKVGVTVFAREWCFSACKNNLTDAAAKASAGSPPESASSAEHDFYASGRQKLRFAGATVAEDSPVTVCGIPFVPSPRVVLRPRFALTLRDLRERVRRCTLAEGSSLILDGDILLEEVELGEGASLVLRAEEGARVAVRGLRLPAGPGFVLEELTAAEKQDPNIPEYLRIRGYRISDQGAVHHHITEPGQWLLTDEGLQRISD
jgi:UDP-sugar pyrophosphorylase